MKDVDRKDGGRENGKGGEARRYYALSAMEVGGVTLLASKNTSCTEHDFESTYYQRQQGHELKISRFSSKQW